MPFYFVSAADGTNVVKVFNEILDKALKYKLNPPDSFMNDVLEFLNEDAWRGHETHHIF